MSSCCSTRPGASSRASGSLSLRRLVGGAAFALGSVAATTAFIGVGLGGARIANVSMLYLVAVLATATLFGLGAAIVASVVAFLAFTWFFVEPVHHLTVADPAEYVTLLLFLLTAAVTGTLAGLQRERTREAEDRRREAVVLYDIARLLAAPNIDAALPAVTRRLAEALDLSGLVVQADRPDDRALSYGEEAVVASMRANPVGGRLLAGDPEAGTRGRWVTVVPPYRYAEARDRARTEAVPLVAGDARIGTLFVRRRSGGALSAADDRLLAAAGALLAQGIEIERLRREALDAEVLRRTDQLKTALLDAVSHDLRTPLASILAASGSLRQRDVDWSDEQRAEFADAIDGEARRLDRLVGDLLDLSRIEAGVLSPRKGWYDVGALCEEVTGRLRPLTAAHRVRVHVPEDLPPVLLDYVEIDQVLSNLIENAAKYAPPGTDIDVSAAVEGDAVRIEVADRGPGIPPGDARDVFAPFRRLRRDVRTTGTGLGLAIARRLVEAHGGRIGVEPRPGGGSRFVFTLPR